MRAPVESRPCVRAATLRLLALRELLRLYALLERMRLLYRLVQWMCLEENGVGFQQRVSEDPLQRRRRELYMQGDPRLPALAEVADQDIMIQTLTDTTFGKVCVDSGAGEKRVPSKCFPELQNRQNS